MHSRNYQIRLKDLTYNSETFIVDFCPKLHNEILPFDSKSVVEAKKLSLIHEVKLANLRKSMFHSNTKSQDSKIDVKTFSRREETSSWSQLLLQRDHVLKNPKRILLFEALYDSTPESNK